MSISSEINDLLAELDEQTINEALTPEQLMELRSKLLPYGRTIQGADRVFTMSYTDLRKEYLMKLLMTTFIGFLNRACDEWNVPDGMVPLPVYEYLTDPAKLDEIDAKVPEKDRLANREWMAKRVIVKEFLEDMFQFNPDKHVRSAYRPNPADPQRREVLDTPAARLAIASHKRTDPILAERLKGLESATKAGGRRIKRTGSTKPTSGAADVAAAVAAETEASDEVKAEAETSDEVKADQKLRDVYEMIPPHDVFYRIKHYMDANYEELREAVQVLYCEKPDLETAINPYDCHGSREEADAFINKHKNEVIAPIYPVYSGKWNFIGPFKQVRDSVRYYNDNTIVLEEIMKQRELDERLGKDLIQKRIKVQKAKNVKEAGDHDPAFIAWCKQNATLKHMEPSTETKTEDDADDCPDNAIEVPVWRVSQLKQNIEKTRFFTAAEAPDALPKPEPESKV